MLVVLSTKYQIFVLFILWGGTSFVKFLNSFTACLIFQKKENSFSFRKCALSIALAIGLVTTGLPTLGWPAYASQVGPALPDLSVLISGPPIKDPGALLRNALPINNKAIREVQKPLEDITDSLKVSGVKALDSVERVSKFKRTILMELSLIL